MRFSSLLLGSAFRPVFRDAWRRLGVRLLVGLGLLLALGGCAELARLADEESKAQVSERARERWALLVKGDADRAYEYLSPASKEAVSLDRFRRRSGAGRWWRNAAVESVDCRQDVCQVRMTVEYDLLDVKGMKRTIDESWVRDGGNWWFVMPK